MESTTRQLKLASAFVIASGLFVLLGSWDTTSEPLRLFAEVLFWTNTEQVEVAKEANLLSAILGGVMLSWGMLYWMLTDLLRDDPARIKRIFLISIWAWFVADTLGSILSGGVVNVLFNLVYLSIFVLPLRNIEAVDPG